MSKERLYSCVIHKTFVVLLLVAVQKPKAVRLLDAKTEAAFCLRRVHLIIRDDIRWLSFSSYQLQAGPAARTPFLFPALQQSDNWSLSKTKTDIRPHLGVVVNSSAIHDVQTEQKSYWPDVLYTFTVSALNTTNSHDTISKCVPLCVKCWNNWRIWGKQKKTHVSCIFSRECWKLEHGRGYSSGARWASSCAPCCLQSFDPAVLFKSILYGETAKDFYVYCPVFTFSS